MSTFFKVFFTVVIAIISRSGIAQNIEGSWTGNLHIQTGMELPVIFDVSKEGDSFTTTLTSPKQSPTPIPVDKTVIEGNTVTFNIATMGIKYTGIFEDQSIKGTFIPLYALEYTKGGLRFLI